MLAAPRRRLLAPERERELIGAHGWLACSSSTASTARGLAPRNRHRTTGGAHLERTQDPELQCGPRTVSARRRRPCQRTARAQSALRSIVAVIPSPSLPEGAQPCAAAPSAALLVATFAASALIASTGRRREPTDRDRPVRQPDVEPRRHDRVQLAEAGPARRARAGRPPASRRRRRSTAASRPARRTSSVASRRRTCAASTLATRLAAPSRRRSRLCTGRTTTRPRSPRRTPCGPRRRTPTGGTDDVWLVLGIVAGTLAVFAGTAAVFTRRWRIRVPA